MNKRIASAKLRRLGPVVGDCVVNQYNRIKTAETERQFEEMTTGSKWMDRNAGGGEGILQKKMDE